MSVEINRINIKDALSKINNYEKALVYCISEANLYDKGNFSEINMEEVVDARFFSKDGELHIYSDGDELVATEVVDNDKKSSDDVEYVDTEYKLKGKAQSIRVREYFDYDEDGQCNVVRTRILEIK